MSRDCLIAIQQQTIPSSSGSPLSFDHAAFSALSKKRNLEVLLRPRTPKILIKSKFTLELSITMYLNDLNTYMLFSTNCMFRIFESYKKQLYSRIFFTDYAQRLLNTATTGEKSSTNYWKLPAPLSGTQRSLFNGLLSAFCIGSLAQSNKFHEQLKRISLNHFDVFLFSLLACHEIKCH